MSDRDAARVLSAFTAAALLITGFLVYVFDDEVWETALLAAVVLSGLSLHRHRKIYQAAEPQQFESGLFIAALGIAVGGAMVGDVTFSVIGVICPIAAAAVLLRRQYRSRGVVRDLLVVPASVAVLAMWGRRNLTALVRRCKDEYAKTLEGANVKISK
ncbi:hypothetical protein [Bailinhaonella thermotolerans]|uniref:Uncharacterized protein n=1 Tax=Bailinhaonella thermotolerans TaxID=1070861 RepID=A0A3A4A1X7_9ACTN|nr:hypothetical protein [Bailinhaonella thermotolerans]RJL21248.1 hypothetical protein D5H75_37920 [Bailinhaonella thermotolerans]